MTINKCNQEFLARNGSFARSLADLGPHGTACLSEEGASNSVAGFQMSYAPKAEADSVTAYDVSARWTSLLAMYPETIASDQQGILLAYYTSAQPNCLTRAPGLFIRLSERLKRDQVMSFSDGEKGFRERFGSPTLEEFLSPNRNDKYDYGYEPQLASDGSLAGFRLAARPRTFGVDTLRSYLMIVDRLPGKTAGVHLRIYATAENRPATTSDPPARMCEVLLGGYELPAELDD